MERDESVEPAPQGCSDRLGDHILLVHAVPYERVDRVESDAGVLPLRSEAGLQRLASRHRDLPFRAHARRTGEVVVPAGVAEGPAPVEDVTGQHDEGTNSVGQPRRPLNAGCYVAFQAVDIVLVEPLVVAQVVAGRECEKDDLLTRAAPNRS